MTDIKRNSVKAWLLAARPKTLAGAAVPVIVGAALAVGYGKFAWLPAVLCFLFAFTMQIAANFINDLVDFRKGTDGVDRLGPERACAQGWISPASMRKGILVTLLAAGGFGLPLVCYGGWWLLLVGAACVLFAFLYTTFMSYRGMGDVLVLLFFGVVPVLGTCYVMTLQVTAVGVLASVACGLVVDTLLVVNNFRDAENDARAGKQTLVVRFGKRFGSYLYFWMGVIASLLCVSFAYMGCVDAAVLPFFYLIPHYFTWRRMNAIGAGRELNKILASTSRNMLVFALLVLLGFLM